ncbi:MAG TPA: phage major capsid protein [Rhizomicrobium sp.]|jgi:HK97 family phage major capsid protein|nr:phage major capsid protein [Rhizomicrobium sp.]
MNMQQSKKLRADRKKIVDEAQALLEIENRTAEQNAKFDELMNAADSLKAEIDRLERFDDHERELKNRVEKIADRAGKTGDEVTEEEAEEAEAFNLFMRGGMNSLSEEHKAIMHGRNILGGAETLLKGLPANLQRQIRNALGTDPSTSGGFLIPEGFGDKITEAQKWYGGMLDPGVAFTFESDSGNPMPWPTDNDTTNTGALLGENSQVTETDPAFGAITLNAYTYTSLVVRMSNQLLNDSAFDLDAYIARKFGIRLGRIQNTHFTTGDGAAKPRGVITAATLTTTGATGETTSLVSDDLYTLKHSVDPAYRKNAKWMFHDTTLKAIKKLKDGIGRPLWTSGLAYKEPDTIDGDPFRVNNDMPQMAANAESVAYGDFSLYFIRRVKGISLIRLTERYADFNQVGFIAFQRVDGNLMDAGTHPVATFANSSS